MRGLLRVIVIAFTMVSLLTVAAVGVAASSAKEGPTQTVKNSVAALLSGHIEQVGSPSVGAAISGSLESNGNGCHPPKKTHKHGTPGHKHHPCGDDEDDDSG